MPNLGAPPGTNLTSFQCIMNPPGTFHISNCVDVTLN